MFALKKVFPGTTFSGPGGGIRELNTEKLSEDDHQPHTLAHMVRASPSSWYSKPMLMRRPSGALPSGSLARPTWRAPGLGFQDWTLVPN